MRSHRWLPASVILITAAGLTVMGGVPASAAPVANLYVDNTASAHCSDAGAGTEAKPYCTLSAATKAVQAGQTVHVTGSYAEHLTLRTSGTANAPIRFESAVDSNGNPQAELTGHTAGITISNLHYVSVSSFGIGGTTSGPSVLVSHSSHVTIEHLTIDASDSKSPATDLVTTAHSTISDVHALVVPPATSLILDRNTSFTTVHDYQVQGAFVTPPSGIGIDVAGDHDTLDGVGTLYASSGIVIEKSADHTTIHNSTAIGNYRDGVLVQGSHTAISNNIFSNNCWSGVHVASTATNTSIENTILGQNGASLRTPPPSGCDPSTEGTPVNLGVYGDATDTTTADYNTMPTQGSATPLYAWKTVQPTLADFQAASGQGAHDIVVRSLSDEEGNPDYDSANSAAPGFPTVDAQGLHREDDPQTPNTGAGPINYADRGIYELTQGASLHGAVTVDAATKTITVQAVIDTAGWSPIAKYTFDFGDGSPVVTQISPVASHTYAKRATYTIQLGEVAVDGNVFTGSPQLVQLGTVYHAVTPTRILNTGEIEPGGYARLNSGPLPGQPASGVVAVLIDVTAHKGTTYGSATAFAATDDDDDAVLAGAGPDATAATPESPGTLHWQAGQTVSNLFTVSIEEQDAVLAVRNNSKGHVEFLVDVVGYETYDTGSYFHATTPATALHTTPVQPRSSTSLSTAGLGLPTAGVTGVALDVTASNQRAAGAITAYPDGTARPAISNVHWSFRQSTTNLVIVPVVNGKVDIYNASDGSTGISADLVGYFATTGSTWNFTPDVTTRIMDTRAKLGVPTSSPVPAHGEVNLSVADVPALAGTTPTTLVINVTVTATSATGTLTVWGGASRPATTNLSFGAHQTVSNRVMVPVVDGQVHFFNDSTGSVAILADLDQYSAP